MMHSFIGFNYNSRKGVRYKMFSTVILNDALLICGRIYFHKKKKNLIIIIIIILTELVSTLSVYDKTNKDQIYQFYNECFRLKSIIDRDDIQPIILISQGAHLACMYCAIYFMCLFHVACIPNHVKMCLVIQMFKSVWRIIQDSNY